MAEQLVIRVIIDGMSGSEGSSKEGSINKGIGAGVAGVGVLAASTSYQKKSQENFANSLEVGSPKFNEWAQKRGFEMGSSSSTKVMFPEYSKVESRGMLSTNYSVPILAETMHNKTNLINTPMRQWGTGTINEHFNANSARYKALGAGTAYKVVNSAINIHQHKSGNSYANAQINNTMKFASYGVALAMSGPLAPAVAAGIAINEIGNAVTSSINYSYDRKQDRNKAKNIAIVAGNMSYGRNRGGY